MCEKYLVCKGATVYCSKSIVNNNPGTAIPLNITSQSTVVINGSKVVATEKDCSVANMNFGLCNMGSTPVPCAANILWSKLYKGANITEQGLKLLTEESEGSCMIGGGKIKIAFHGQVATPHIEAEKEVSWDIISAILPVASKPKEDTFFIETLSLEDENKEKKIISIDILDDHNMPVTGDYVKFVNLPTESRFVDGNSIKGFYQLDVYIKCRVKFDGGGANKFKLYVVEDPGNEKYSNTEKDRNINFEHQEAVLEFETDLNGEKTIEGEEIFLSQAGGNKYHLQAKDCRGNVVESVCITTHRKLYFVEVKMDNLSTITKSLTEFLKEYETHFITFEKFAEVTIPHIKNIGSREDKESFLKTVETAYKAHYEMAPFCLVIAYTDHLAVKCNNLIIETQQVFVGPLSPAPILIRIYNGSTAEMQALWHNIDDEDWYVDCKYFDFTTGLQWTIGKELITPLATSSFPGFYSVIAIDVRGLPNGVGRIGIQVNTVSRMVSGTALGSNTVAVCTRSWWSAISELVQNQVVIHEIGHELGMVPNGEDRYLDKPINFYDGEGHNGPHCRQGLPLQADYGGLLNITNSTCVMFGTTNGKTNFCVDCAKCVKKLDLLCRL